VGVAAGLSATGAVRSGNAVGLAGGLSATGAVRFGTAEGVAAGLSATGAARSGNAEGVAAGLSATGAARSGNAEGGFCSGACSGGTSATGVSCSGAVIVGNEELPGGVLVACSEEFPPPRTERVSNKAPATTMTIQIATVAAILARSSKLIVPFCERPLPCGFFR
jgi:hypothetical protein